MSDLALASAVIEPKWTTSVLFHLASAPTRFGELRRLVGSISEKVLIQRLRTLEREALISRHVEGTVPPQVTYAMTAHGRTLCALIEAMAAWGAVHRKHHELGRAVENPRSSMSRDAERSPVAAPKRRTRR